MVELLACLPTDPKVRGLPLTIFMNDLNYPIKIPALLNQIVFFVFYTQYSQNGLVFSGILYDITPYKILLKFA